MGRRSHLVSPKDELWLEDKKVRTCFIHREEPVQSHKLVQQYGVFRKI